MLIKLVHLNQILLSSSPLNALLVYMEYKWLPTKYTTVSKIILHIKLQECTEVSKSQSHWQNFQLGCIVTDPYASSLYVTSNDVIERPILDGF